MQIAHETAMRKSSAGPSRSKAAAARSSDSDGDEDTPSSNSEEHKLAIRRAKNREAARRVRERRMNAIKTLSEQVEVLVAENTELRERLQASGDPHTPSPTTSTAAGGKGHKPGGTSRTGTADAAVQTDQPPLGQEHTWEPLMRSLSSQLQASLQQAADGERDGQQAPQPQAPSPGAAAQAAMLQPSQASAQMVNLQQIQMLLQMQMQMLQLHSGAPGLPAQAAAPQPQQQQRPAGGWAFTAQGGGEPPNLVDRQLQLLEQQQLLLHQQQQQQPQPQLQAQAQQAKQQRGLRADAQPPAPGAQRRRPAPSAAGLPPPAPPGSAAAAAMAPPAAAAAAAAAGDAQRFKPIPEVLCQLDEDAVLMSTEMNLPNTAEMNLNTSECNAMLASEEILHHVPTPEEAIASRSTAWL